MLIYSINSGIPLVTLNIMNLPYGFQGAASEELSAAAKLEDDVNFYQTNNPDVAKIFQIDPQVKRPALVLIKKEAEKINHFSQYLDLMF